MHSATAAIARLQTHSLAAGVPTRARARAPASPRSSTARARRSASAWAASDSSARSPSTLRISGCASNGLPKAWRWQAWCSDCTRAWRSNAALPSTQSRRVVAAISSSTARPRPGSPTMTPHASSNSTSALALL
ncbi:Uncharacterised protein [Achromobacter ruhlandii]|nr:Uncharacterised protein [Achromobacter ruhlandii]CUK15873.1 Uncharacterised protein [Achromobacter ruhlandii]